MNKDKPKRYRIPHVFVLLTGVILFCTLFSYVVTSGIYQRGIISTGEHTPTVVIPGTYEKLPKHISFKGILIGDKADQKASPVSLLGFLTAIPRGMTMTGVSEIIFMIFIISGVLGVFQRTGTITSVIQALLDRFSNSGPLLTIILMTVIGVGGSTFGMGEELIPLVPIFLIVSSKLGYDRLYGLSIVYLGALIGFAAATTNPFTVQIAQSIAEVPTGSGISFRIIFFVVIMAATISYVLLYGKGIKKDLSRSILAGDNHSIAEANLDKQSLKTNHI